MSEPDFQQIAERIALRTGAFQVPIGDIMAELVEQLRLVWNARGAADIELLTEHHPHLKERTWSGLRSLDR